MSAPHMPVPNSRSPLLVLDSLPPPAAERQAGKLLLVQSTERREALLRDALASERLELLAVSCAEDVHERVHDVSPDVLVVDASTADWAALCRALKTGQAASMPIVIVDWAGWTEAAAVGALE